MPIIDNKIMSGGLDATWTFNIDRPSLSEQQISSAMNSLMKLQDGHAIYYEKAHIVHVRVSRIWNEGHRVFAELTPLETQGLETRSEPWTIFTDLRLGKNYEDEWQMGYGGWALIHDRDTIARVLQIGAQFAPGTPYREIFPALSHYLNVTRLDGKIP